MDDDYFDLSDRIADAMANSKQPEVVQQRRFRMVDTLFEEIYADLKTTSAKMARFDQADEDGMLLWDYPPLDPYRFERNGFPDSGRERAIQQPAQSQGKSFAGVVLSIGVQFIDAEERIYLFAGYAVGRKVERSALAWETLWAQSWIAPSGSSELRQKRNDLVAAVNRQLRPALTAFASAVESLQ